MNDALTNNNPSDGFKDLKEIASELLSPMKTLGNSIADMVTYSNQLNNNFGLGRSRIQEMNVAFADSAARITALGGSLSNVVNVISDIADASNRNVIENEETIANIYSASKILGIEVKALVNNFKNVGYETSQIGPNLEDSIQYIQSVGLNARKVIQDVSNNMENMNRYRFEGGVLGFTKMAAQASMLRFDMSETFRFAESVLKPEKAIEVAAAFQRLGATSSLLTDPLAMMYKSLTDPSGLQKELTKLGDQFVGINEMGQFEISRTGVLILREMEEAANLTTGSLAKAALASANLNKRISEVSAVGLEFKTEEDKQYLENILSMSKDGKYIVTLTNDTKKELKDLNQKEFDELIEQQRNAPKTLEQIQKSQLGFLQSMTSDLKSILNTLKFGAASNRMITSNLEGFRNIMTTLTTTAQKRMPQTGEVREGAILALEKFEKFIEGFNVGSITLEDLAKEFGNIEKTLLGKGSNLAKESIEFIKGVMSETAKSIKGNSDIERYFRGQMGEAEYYKSVMSQNTLGKQKIMSPVRREAIVGSTIIQKNYKETIKEVYSKIDFGGTIVLDIKAPAGVSEQQFKQWWKQLSESEDFSRAMTQFNQKQLKKLEKIS
jgi:hypothetical protein